MTQIRAALNKSEIFLIISMEITNSCESILLNYIHWSVLFGVQKINLIKNSGKIGLSI